MDTINSKLCFQILSVLLFGLTISASAQQTANELAPRRVIFTVVQQQPEFPGGVTALQNYIADNLKYPEGVDKKLRNQTVFAKFIITETGQIDSAQVLKPNNELVDAEVIRVIKNMPAWTPGKQNGHIVAVWYNVPVHFPKK